MWVTLPTVQHSGSSFWRPSTEIHRPSIIHKQWSEASSFLFLFFSPVDIAPVCFFSQWQQWTKIALTETHPEESQIKHHYSLGKYCEEISSPPAARGNEGRGTIPGVLWSTLNQALLREDRRWRSSRQLPRPLPSEHVNTAMQRLAWRKCTGAS